MKPVEDRIDESYTLGRTDAYNDILRKCVQMLGYELDISKLLELQVKLITIKKKLVEIAEELGDDADLSNLDEFDIADKHILPIVLSMKIQQKVKIVSSSQRNLFDFWRFMLNHPQARESEKYLKPIVQRLKEGYTIPQLSQAIYGLSLSKYHLENGYTHIHYALKDDRQILMMVQTAKKSNITEEDAEKLYNWFIERKLSGRDIKELISIKDKQTSTQSTKSTNPKTGEKLL